MSTDRPRADGGRGAGLQEPGCAGPMRALPVGADRPPNKRARPSTRAHVPRAAAGRDPQQVLS